jgi:hypothetical protein
MAKEQKAKRAKVRHWTLAEEPAPPQHKSARPRHRGVGTGKSAWADWHLALTPHSCLGRSQDRAPLLNLDFGPDVGLDFGLDVPAEPVARARAQTDLVGRSVGKVPLLDMPLDILQMILNLAFGPFSDRTGFFSTCTRAAALAQKLGAVPLRITADSSVCDLAAALKNKQSVWLQRLSLSPGLLGVVCDAKSISAVTITHSTFSPPDKILPMADMLWILDSLSQLTHLAILRADLSAQTLTFLRYMDTVSYTHLTLPTM